MQLYVVPGSPNCRKVIVAIKLLNLDVEIRQVDFRGGENRSPEFLAKNPNGAVPVLVDGDLSLWESAAIMTYLAEQAGEAGKALWPASAAGRADILRWLSWDLAHFGKALSTLAFENLLRRAFGMGEPNEVFVNEALRSFNRYAAVLNAHLTNRTFVVGEGLTLADLALAASFSNARAAGAPVDEFPAILNWYARMEALPEWAATGR